MHRSLAGLFLLLVCIPTANVLAQAKGEVESIGFGSMYRPNCHVPMLVRVQADKSGTYQIRIKQSDMDADQPLYTATVSLTGTEEGKGAEQRFWLYFLPTPINGGLPDVTRGGTLRELQNDLQVFLCDEKGKQIVQLAVTRQGSSTITNIEGAAAGPFSVPRGTKLILAVGEGASQPVWRDYRNAIGTMEDVIFESVRPSDIPEDVRGLEMVDAILWLNAAVPDPAREADAKRYHAIQEYVRSGGHLVICQPAQRDATAAWGELLPVTVNRIDSRNDAEPLATWATAGRAYRNRSEWALKGPFQVARGEPKKGAIVDETIAWNADGTDRSPYIARRAYGVGAVTWVAQDLSDPSLTSKAKLGWPLVWDKVFDWHNDTLVVDNLTSEDQKKPYLPVGNTDGGYSFLSGMELRAKSNLLIAIAVVFFIAYWALAGPGVYLFLLSKSRAQMSWFMFAASAVAATALTVLVVKLVVRGAPELSHITVVRGAPGEPALQFSRFGLYIPRDGAQEIALKECAPNHVSYITPFPVHPSHSPGDIEFPAQLQYLIPIRDSAAGEPVSISIPYRSTLKKLQVRRVGAAEGIIDGSAVLRETEGQRVLEGKVTNGTGQKLKNVYLAYRDLSNRSDRSDRSDDDQILFLPDFAKGQTIDLRAEFFDDKAVKFIGTRKDTETGSTWGTPEQRSHKLKGPMGLPGTDHGWSRYWFSERRATGMNSDPQWDDSDKDVNRAFPVMSLFSRLPPMMNVAGQSADRGEVLRRGARFMDMSPAVAAGRLVVLAEGDGRAPLPYELDVDGTKVEGKGAIFYQFSLPLERVREAPPATTQPVARVTE